MKNSKEKKGNPINFDSDEENRFNDFIGSHILNKINRSNKKGKTKIKKVRNKNEGY